MKCMKKALFKCLHFDDLPPERGKSIRTTKILERAFREVSRRCRPNGFLNLPKNLFYVLKSLGKSLLICKSFYLGYKSFHLKYINNHNFLTVTQEVCYSR